jgi:hypothetical protein
MGYGILGNGNNVIGNNLNECPSVPVTISYWFIQSHQWLFTSQAVSHCDLVVVTICQVDTYVLIN